jgi:hypothetical protein
VWYENGRGGGVKRDTEEYEGEEKEGRKGLKMSGRKKEKGKRWRRIKGEGEVGEGKGMKMD